MRVRFDATFDEFVDAAYRSWRQQSTVVPIWRRDVTVGALLGACVAYLIADGLFETRLIASVLGAVFGGIFSRIFREVSVKRSLTRAYRDWLTGKTTATVEFEARPNGLWVGQNDTEMLWPWRDVVAIDDAPADVLIRFRDGGVAVVRARAFPDPAARAAFVGEIRTALAGRHEERRAET